MTRSRAGQIHDKVCVLRLDDSTRKSRANSSSAVSGSLPERPPRQFLYLWDTPRLTLLAFSESLRTPDGECKFNRVAPQVIRPLPQERAGWCALNCAVHLPIHPGDVIFADRRPAPWCPHRARPPTSRRRFSRRPRSHDCHLCGILRLHGWSAGCRRQGRSCRSCSG